MELHNYRTHVIPAAEYLDYKGLLYTIPGERKPDEVFSDFQKVFNTIIASDNKIRERQLKSAGSYRDFKTGTKSAQSRVLPPVIHSPPEEERSSVTQPIIFIIGGPGSNKHSRMGKIREHHPTWVPLHTGNLVWEHLRDLEESSSPDSEEKAEDFHTLLRKGDLVKQELVLQLMEKRMEELDTAEGFFVSGFPRDINQLAGFQDRFDQKPHAILVDCSELELGRSLGQRTGRIDDNLEAARRRLELYRELTLPLLKALDEEDRLQVVDGDADNDQVLEDLREAVDGAVKKALEISVISATAEDAIPEEDEEAVAEEGEEGDGEDIDTFIDEIEKEIDADFTKLENDIAAEGEETTATVANGHVPADHDGIDVVEE